MATTAARATRLLLAFAFVAFSVADAQHQTSSPLSKLPQALLERATQQARRGGSSITNYATFNDTLVSLAGEEGFPFAVTTDPKTGEECAALCAAVTSKATAASKKGAEATEGGGGTTPRCFSAAFDVTDVEGEDGKKKQKTSCSLFGWSKGDPCPRVEVSSSGGTTSYFDPKALSASLGACSAPTATSAPVPARKRTRASSVSALQPQSGNDNDSKEKRDALSAIAQAVKSSLPPAPPDPAAAATAASAAAASLASASAAAAGGDDAAARAQAWAAVVDAKPGAAVAVVGARPPVGSATDGHSAASRLNQTAEYLGTVTDVPSAAVCSGICQQFAAGADNAGGEIAGVTVFPAGSLAGSRGYYGVSDGPLQAHCVAASYYDGDVALGIDPRGRESEGQTVGHVCDLFAVAPRGATTLVLEPVVSTEGQGNSDLARSTVTFVRPQRWSELDYALED